MKKYNYIDRSRSLFISKSTLLKGGISENTINRLNIIGYHKYKTIQINKFSSSKILSNPGRKQEQEQEEVSKWSISTPETPDIDPAKAKRPVFESDKLNADENIQKELQEKNFPTDKKVVDAIVDKHVTERDRHIAAFHADLKHDETEEILVLKKARLADEIDDKQYDQYMKSTDRKHRALVQEHNQDCEEENTTIRLQIAHYKAIHCVETPEAESSSKGQSTVDFVLEKQKTEMPDIPDSDGGGE